MRHHILTTLEQPLHFAHNSVKLLDLALKTLTSARHPSPPGSYDGYALLLVREQDLETVNYAMACALEQAESAVSALMAISESDE